MGELVAVILAGIAQGIPLFLVASGLTLIYGVMHVLNFAHGAFFMLGALWLTLTLEGQARSVALYLLVALVAAIAVSLTGVISERLALRRLYSADHVTMLLATYALLLILQGGAETIWGNVPRTQRPADAFSGNITVIGATIPVYDLFLMTVGVMVAVALWVLLQRTEFGRRIRAIAQDSTMAQALGINAERMKYMVFAIGCLLAGLAGALSAPLVSVTPNVGGTIILQSFAVVIVGGLGSISGAFIAAIILGLAESFVISYLPVLTGFTLYIAVAFALLLRPRGILGSPTALQGSH